MVVRGPLLWSSSMSWQLRLGFGCRGSDRVASRDRATRSTGGGNDSRGRSEESGEDASRFAAGAPGRHAPCPSQGVPVGRMVVGGGHCEVRSQLREPVGPRRHHVGVARWEGRSGGQRVPTIVRRSWRSEAACGGGCGAEKGRWSFAGGPVKGEP